MRPYFLFFSTSCFATSPHKVQQTLLSQLEELVLSLQGTDCLLHGHTAKAMVATKVETSRIWYVVEIGFLENVVVLQLVMV